MSDFIQGILFTLLCFAACTPLFCVFFLFGREKKFTEAEIHKKMHNFVQRLKKDGLLSKKGLKLIQLDQETDRYNWSKLGL